MTSGRLDPTWRETLGMIDAVLQERDEPDSLVTWVNRYGQSRTGNQYRFSLGEVEEGSPLRYDTIAISDSEIGMQECGRYDSLTGKFNEIDYRPAYCFYRLLGRSTVVGVIISRDDGNLTVPIFRGGNLSNMLDPKDVIKDIHQIMLGKET